MRPPSSPTGIPGSCRERSLVAVPAGREAAGSGEGEGACSGRRAALRCGAHRLRAAIPAGGGRCRKDRFLRSPPLPSPVLTLTSAQGAGGTLRSPLRGSWGPGLRGTCPLGPGLGRAGRAAWCRGRRPAAGAVGGAKPRPPLLPFAGCRFQAGHLIHNPPPLPSGCGRSIIPFHPQILPRAWMYSGCARPRSVRQPPGNGRETGEHLRPHPNRFPTGVRPPFERVLAYPMPPPRSPVSRDLCL